MKYWLKYIGIVLLAISVMSGSVWLNGKYADYPFTKTPHTYQQDKEVS
jgi:hypothetical protein